VLAGVRFCVTWTATDVQAADNSRLPADEHDELRQMSLSRSLPAGDVIKARMILMLSGERSYAEIQERLQTTAPTISRSRVAHQ
jgi:hypothetical protein